MHAAAVTSAPLVAYRVSVATTAAPQPRRHSACAWSGAAAKFCSVVHTVRTTSTGTSVAPLRSDATSAPPTPSRCTSGPRTGSCAARLCSMLQASRSTSVSLACTSSAAANAAPTPSFCSCTAASASHALDRLRSATHAARTTSMSATNARNVAVAAPPAPLATSARVTSKEVVLSASCSMASRAAAADDRGGVSDAVRLVAGATSLRASAAASVRVTAAMVGRAFGWTDRQSLIVFTTAAGTPQSTSNAVGGCPPVGSVGAPVNTRHANSPQSRTSPAALPVVPSVDL